MKKLILTPLVLFFFLLILFSAAQADPAAMPYPAGCSIFYRTLDNGKKGMFDIVYDALYTGESGVDVPEVCTRQEAWLLLNQMFNECPELCAFHPDTVEYTVSPSSGKVTYIRLGYKRSVSEQRSFIARVSSIAKDFDSFGDVVSYVCRNMRYDYESTDNGRMYAYESMQRGKAVCNGYAQTVVMLCHFAHVECSYIDGLAGGGGHAWVIVGENGLYTLSDVTWADKDNGINYGWIGLSTADMNASHTPYGDRYVIPACVNTQGTLRLSARESVFMLYDAIGFMLRSGNRGDNVRALQRRLIQLGYLNGGADGVYGDKTKAAVALFQRNNGIYGVEGASGVATELTQAALYSGRAVPRNGTARIPVRSLPDDRTPFSIWTGDIDISGSNGFIRFRIRNDNPTQSIVAMTIRYWADGADGSLVYSANDYTLWGICIKPGESREISFDFSPDPSLRRASLVKWNIIEVEYANGEVFISENLSGYSEYIIRTFNQNVTPR